MGFKRKAIDTYEAAMDQAMRFLSARFLSCMELRQKLRQKKVSRELIERVERRLIELGYLDDERLSKEALRLYMEAEKYSAVYIRQKMQQRGLSIGSAFSSYDETVAARRILQQKGLWPFEDESYVYIDDTNVDADRASEEYDTAPIDAASRQAIQYKMMKVLHNRGFSMHTIREIVAMYEADTSRTV